MSLTLTLNILPPSTFSVMKTASTTPVSVGLTATEVSLRYGPLISNSLYSSMNLGGDVLPMTTSPPVTWDSCMTTPSPSRSL